jgi:hypothetical protein
MPRVLAIMTDPAKIEKVKTLAGSSYLTVAPAFTTAIEDYIVKL